MRIRMKTTMDGCEDGFTVRTYVAGEEYEVAELLAQSFIAGGDAEPVEEKPARKAHRAAPENKAT